MNHPLKIAQKMTDPNYRCCKGLGNYHMRGEIATLIVAWGRVWGREKLTHGRITRPPRAS
jgi:hypothetical protein